MTNGERLYCAFTEIDDKLIGEARETPLKKPRRLWLRYASAAAALIVLIGAGALIIPRIGGNAAHSPGSGGGSGHGEGIVFMSYAGPVLPMTLTQEDGELSATREITLDLAPTLKEGSDVATLWDIGVSDSYAITNTGSTAKTVTVLYPFIGQFKDLDMPVASCGGSVLDTELYAGPYSGGFKGAGDEQSTSMNLNNIDSWEGYKALLADGTYMAEAFSQYPELSAPVTVYEFTDITDGGSDAVNPTLNMTFNMDYDRSIILTYGFNGGRYDPDTGDTARHFSIPSEGERGYGDSRFVAVLGDDIGEYALEGYEDGGCEAGGEIDGASAAVTRYETTLGELMGNIAQRFYEDVVGSEFDGDDNRFIDSAISYEMYFGSICRFFARYGVAGEEAKERYDFGALEDIIGETVFHNRVFYLAADITVGAGETAEIDFSMRKEPSFDFICASRGDTGILSYEAVTAIGTNLAFVSQSARLENAENIEIVRQNFGFDQSAGILSVALDPAVERYFLELRPKADAEPQS